MKELNLKDKDEEAGSSKGQNAATAEVRMPALSPERIRSSASLGLTGVSRTDF